MSIQEYFNDKLQSHGLTEGEANEVLKIAMPKINETATVNWPSDSATMPQISMVAIWLHVKHHAHQWATQNCPEAWFIPLLSND